MLASALRSGPDAAGLPERRRTVLVTRREIGLGVSIVFICDDAVAIYREATAKGIQASRPFVGNGMWVTSLRDPDGYGVEFESCTDVPEDTLFSEDKG